MSGQKQKIKIIFENYLIEIFTTIMLNNAPVYLFVKRRISMTYTFRFACVRVCVYVYINGRERLKALSIWWDF